MDKKNQKHIKILTPIRVVKPKDIKDYLKCKGVLCPYCKSNKVYTGDHEMTDIFVFVNTTCLDCKNRWTDEYSLTGIICD